METGREQKIRIKKSAFTGDDGTGCPDLCG